MVSNAGRRQNAPPAPALPADCLTARDRDAQVRLGRSVDRPNLEGIAPFHDVDQQWFARSQDARRQAVVKADRRRRLAVPVLAVVRKVDGQAWGVEQRHVDDVGVERFTHPVADELDHRIAAKLRADRRWTSLTIANSATRCRVFAAMRALSSATPMADAMVVTRRSSDSL